MYRKEVERFLDDISVMHWYVYDGEKDEPEYLIEGDEWYGASVILIERDRDYVVYAVDYRREERGEDWEVPGSRQVVPYLEGVEQYLEEWLDRGLDGDDVR